MTKSILKQIFNGELYPSEQIVFTDPKYPEASQKRSDMKESFIDSLSKEAQQTYENIEVLTAEIEDMYNYECFAEGFRIGAALAMETSQRRSKGSRR